MSIRLRLRRRTEHCDVCGKPVDEKTRIYFGVRTVTEADRGKLLSYVYGGTKKDMPSLVYMPLLACPGHEPSEFLRAGIVPDGMINGMENLHEVMDEVRQVMRARWAAA